MPDRVSCEACFAAVSRSATGGGLISRGHLYKILSNPIYLGPSAIRARSTKAFTIPIIDQETWDRVQLLLAEHAQRTAGSRQHSDALLACKDRGNRMSPTHATS